MLDRLADLKDLLKDRGRDMADIKELLLEVKDVLAEIQDLSSESASTPTTKSYGSLLKIAGSPGGQWSMAILAAGYVYNGGDILTLLEKLAKLFI